MIMMILVVTNTLMIKMIMMTIRMFLIMKLTRFNSWRGKKSFEKSPDSDPKTASKKVSTYVVLSFVIL